MKHCEELSQKLNRANGILSKSRHFVSPKLLKNIYYAIFSSHLTYGSQIWGQNINTYIDNISIIQKNAVRIITFAEFNAHTDPIFKKLRILKIKDHITLQNCLLVYDFINNKLPKSFNKAFVKVKDIHTITTSTEFMFRGPANPFSHVQFIPERVVEFSITPVSINYI